MNKTVRIIKCKIKEFKVGKVANEATCYSLVKIETEEGETEDLLNYWSEIDISKYYDSEEIISLHITVSGIFRYIYGIGINGTTKTYTGVILRQKTSLIKMVLACSFGALLLCFIPTENPTLSITLGILSVALSISPLPFLYQYKIPKVKDLEKHSSDQGCN